MAEAIGSSAPAPAYTSSGGLSGRVAVDRIEAAAHTRDEDRRLHARGAIYTGRFLPSGHLQSMTTAPHLRHETDVVVRMSNGAPNVDADDRRPGVRGMAVKFVSGGAAVADLVADSGVPVRRTRGSDRRPHPAVAPTA